MLSKLFFQDRIASQNIYKILGITILLVGLIFAISYVLPPGIDWDETYFPAARELLFGRNPYNVQGFFHPTWTLFPILPLALLPSNVGRAAFLVLSLFAFGYSAFRLGAKPLALGAFLISPPVLHCLLNANIDWMPVLGFVLPPQIGLFLVVIKPQVGSTVALFWLIEAWRKNGWREVLRVFAPVTLGLLLSFAIFGLWPLRYGKTLSFWWNASLWPMSIPVGLALVMASIRKRKMEYAMGAAPCLSPYVLFHSWSGALAAILSAQAETLVAVVGLWILVILRAIG